MIYGEVHFQRLLFSVPIFIGITLAVYIMSNMAPGSIVDQVAAASDTGMTQEQIVQLKAQYGLDNRSSCATRSGWAASCTGTLATSYKTNQTRIYVLGPAHRAYAGADGLLAAIGAASGHTAWHRVGYKPRSVWTPIANF